MRRALLTAAPAAAVSVTVGNSTNTSAAISTVGAAWHSCNPASATGFLNTASIRCNALTASYAFFTISPGNVVTDISATITTDLATGVNTVTLPAPLAVNAGDYIGIWISGATADLNRANLAGVERRFTNAAIAKPTPGATLTTDATGVGTHWLISATT